MIGHGAQSLSADEELWSLVETIVEGTATSAEQARLETRLQAEPQARLFYVAYLDLHAHLQWSMRGEAPPHNGTRQPGARQQKLRRFRRIFGAPLRAAVALCLVLAVGLLLTVLVHRREPEEGEALDLPNAPPGSVAVLINNQNTVWEH